VADITAMLTASIIALITEAVNTSETSVNLYYQTTRHNLPEDSHLHTRRRENLKHSQQQISPNKYAQKSRCKYNRLASFESFRIAILLFAEKLLWPYLCLALLR
jgi:hypothetical protein